MKRILIADDDPVVLRLYQEALSKHGLQVDTAPDGIAAVKALLVSKPDLLVLDLMMPRMSGVAVLQAIRAEPRLANLPVVVLSNAYMNDMAREAAAAGVQKALLKMSCNPATLLAVINEVLENKPANLDSSELLAVRQAAPGPTPPVSDCNLAGPQPTARPLPAAWGEEYRPPEPPARAGVADADDAAFQAKARGNFLSHASATGAACRQLFQSFTAARNAKEQALRLQDLYRKVHFVTATAGLAGSPCLAQLACALEALLFEVAAKPRLLSPSVLNTLAATMDFLEQLFERAGHDSPAVRPTSQVLVVDDDPVASRLAVGALRNAHLQARSLLDPVAAFECLQRERFDLLLLDVEMPGMDGFELCWRLRALPGYARAPVVFVTTHFDFERCSRSVFGGGDDLIAKPVLPLELAVKAIAHLLKQQLS
jgi:CheY-like chemotaxis protein